MQIAVPFRRAEGIVELLVKCVKFFVNRVRLGIGLEDARFQAGHRLLRGGVILVRARHNGSRNGRTKRARLRRARNFHRPASHVRVNLHHHRIFFRNAAAIDDLPDLHAVFLKAVDDGQRAKRRGFDERAVNFRRRGVKRLAEQQAGQAAGPPESCGCRCSSRARANRIRPASTSPPRPSALRGCRPCHQVEGN